MTNVGARKPVVESLALSTEASRDNTGLEISFAFSVNPKVLACARRWGGPNGQTARNLDGATQPGVRLRRAQLRSRLVQFPSEVEITSARNTCGVTSEDDATDRTKQIA